MYHISKTRATCICNPTEPNFDSSEEMRPTMTMTPKFTIVSGLWSVDSAGVRCCYEKSSLMPEGGRFFLSVEITTTFSRCNCDCDTLFQLSIVMPQITQVKIELNCQVISL